MKQRFLKNSAIGAVLVFVVLVFPAINCFSQQAQEVHPSHHGFDDIELSVKRFEDPERDKWQKPEEIIKNLNLNSGDIIADIGAGTGYFTRRLAVAVGPGGKALGLDIEPAMVKHMNEDAQKLSLKNYEARLVKPDNPELEPHSVDVVFICDTYHHIENRVGYLKRLSKSLKKNGRVVIVDFYKKPLPVGPPLNLKLSEKTVLEEFRQAGYHLKRSLDFLPYQYFLEFEFGSN